MTYLGDLQPTCIGVIIHLLSTVDIPVVVSILADPSMFIQGSVPDLEGKQIKHVLKTHRNMQSSISP